MIRNVALQSPAGAAREQALVIPVYKGTRKLSSGAARMDRAFGGVGAVFFSEGFSAERGETRMASIKRGRRLVHTVLVGLGDRTNATPEELSDAAGAAAKVLLQHRVESAALYLDDLFAGTNLDVADATHAVVKAFGLACHQLKPRPTARLSRITLRTTRSSREITPAIRRARLLVDWTVRVRDWVNTPGNEMGPASFTDDAKRALTKGGVTCRVLTRKQIEAEDMNGVLAVGVGSREEPRFLVAEHALAKKNWPLVCLVGKGVTFDSGGLSIKPWEKMNEMKSDMAGAASVIAATAMAAELEIPVRLVAIAPCVENMPDGSAFRPGDVIKLKSGKTVEVLSTDAEGRLILADAVAYARAHYQPSIIIDMATLTGGVLIALGTRVAGIMGNSPRDLDDLETAGERSGEPVWPLPLDDRFMSMIKGEVSDYKNYGGRNASAITGAALIGTSAEKTPWVHIDIAGTSWNDGTGYSYQARGGTGYGVDLLLRFLEIVAARA